MSPLRWTTTSIRKLAEQLTAAGHPASAWTVANLLREQGFSLQANAKQIEGRQHPDRDAQFGYLNAQAADHLAAGEPVISVDTKKKELVGQYRNGGKEYLPKGEPESVNVHDFFDKDLGKAIPYGVRPGRQRRLGQRRHRSRHLRVRRADHTQLVAASRAAAYPNAARLLISADGGGSNGYRVRLWKTELANLASEIGLHITVCHLPPGTSKWNKSSTGCSPTSR